MTSKALVIPEEDVRRGGAVSIFGTYIHPNYASVNEDAVNMTAEYNAEMKMDMYTHTIADIPNIGPTHVTALCIPHCLDDRLSIMTRFTELTFLNDDYYDDAGQDKVKQYNDDLQRFFGGEVEDEKTASKAMTKGMFARFLIEMLAIDRVLCSDLMATYSRILEPTSLPDNSTIKTFADYLPFRVGNSGLEVFQDMACFGMGLKLSTADKEKLAPIINVCHHATFLINDFWSWPKEVSKYFENSEPNLPPNAVCVMMQEYNCPEAEAQQRVRDEIVTQQKLHLAMIKELEEQEGPLPEDWHRYFRAVQQTASGSEYWSCYSPRYPKKQELKQPEILIVDGKLKYKTGSWEFVPWKPGQVQLKPAGSNGVVAVNDGKPLKPPNGTSSTLHAITQNGEKRSSSAAEPATNGVNSRSNKRQAYDGADGGFVKAPAETVLAPYKYIAAMPSKNIREKFIDALDLWLQVPRGSLDCIKRIVGQLHHSSLMLDDIEDNSTLRRGLPCTHVLFGEAQTINAANYAFVSAFDEVQNLKSSAAPGIFIREVMNMHCGQALDLSWKYHAHCPTVDDYMMMIDNKTGAMFRLCVQLMQAESSVPSEHINPAHFVTQLGRYFQVRDDHQNLVSTEYTDQKGFCEDLDEGKISLPLIYTLMNPSSERAVIKGILKHRQDDQGLPLHVKKYILQQMKGAGALDATLSLAREMQGNLIGELHEMEEAFGKKNTLVELILRRLWV